MNNSIIKKKLHLGLIYGLVAGLAFAVFTWGVDALLLARANTSYFWIKFVPGLIICLLAGGSAGWLTIRIEKHLIALLFWGLLAYLFSWMVIWMPTTGYQILLKSVDPSLASYFDFSQLQDVLQFRWISMVVVGLAAIIGGLLEINLVHQALLSPYPSSFLTAILVCLVLFGLAGSATDHMINTNLREPMQVVHNMLKFAADNVGVDVPRATARAMHLSAVSQLEGLYQKPHRLILVGFSPDLVFIYILADFEGTKAKCTTIFNQPTDCIILPFNP